MITIYIFPNYTAFSNPHCTRSVNQKLFPQDAISYPLSPCSSPHHPNVTPFISHPRPLEPSPFQALSPLFRTKRQKHIRIPHKPPRPTRLPLIPIPHNLRHPRRTPPQRNLLPLKQWRYAIRAAHVVVDRALVVVQRVREMQDGLPRPDVVGVLADLDGDAGRRVFV